MKHYDGKICLTVLAMVAFVAISHVFTSGALAQAWRSRYGPPVEGGTIVNQTINNLTSTTINNETITITEQITIQETVDPNVIFDAVGAALEDWWDLVDSSDNKKKGGKGNPSDKATNTVYYWDVNGVHWHEPNAAPDLVADGEHQYDSDDEAIEYTDGTVDFLIAQKVKLFSISIFDPATIQATDGDVPILPVEAEKFPGGITLLSVGIKTDNSSTYSVTFKEFTSPADGSPSTIETVATSGATEAEDNGTLTDSAIASGSIVYATIPATAGTNFLQLWGTYYVNDND
jgi:hypothetical protein